MKNLALDTNIAIEILNGTAKTVAFLNEIDQVYLPVPVCGELLFGATNSSKKQTNLDTYKAFIRSCNMLNTTLLVAEEYANIRSQLKKQGRPIPENDIWIAAICRTHDIPLATRDKHFNYIDGLRLTELPT